MDQTLPPTNSFNLKKVAPFVIAGIILLGGVIFALVNLNRNPDSYQFPSITSEEPQAEVPEYTAPVGESLVLSYEPSTTGNAVDLYLEPQEPIDNLTTFGMELSIASDSNVSESQFKSSLAPTFADDGWSILVNKVLIGDSIKVQLAGLRGDVEPYPVTERTHIATVTLPGTIDAQEVMISVEPELSEAFDKHMTVYKIIAAQESAEL